MAGPNADPVAGVTYASSRGAREKTGLNAVNDFTKNAAGDYAQMLADKAAQTEANALPLGGSGIGKLNEAIENSPQLQSGLMAAGLSLMFGGDAESAITTGLGAASNYNQQVTAEEDKKKAEMLAGAKQQSQMEHSYEQGNLMQRQPDSFGLQAAQMSVGAARDQNAFNLLKERNDRVFSLMQPGTDAMGNPIPGMTFAEAANLVDSRGIRDPSRMFGLSFGPTVKTPTANLPDYRKFIATPAGQAMLTSARAFGKTAEWQKLTPAEKISYANSYITEAGLGNTIGPSDLVKEMDGTPSKTDTPVKADKPAKKPLPAPRPIYDPRLDYRSAYAAYRTTLDETGPTAFQQYQQAQRDKAKKAREGK